jgi:hypothetical protein
MSSEDLRQKIIAIICEEWPTPDGYLLGFDIYERLRSQGGIEVTHHAVNTVLSGLATSGHITLTMAAGEGRPPGAVIYDVEDDLCE